MDAHDPTGHQAAHRSPLPSLKPKFINIDETGVSMSWRTATIVILAVATGILAVVAFIATLATKADVEAHDVDPTAHVIAIRNPYSKEVEPRPLAEIVEDVQNDVADVKTKVVKIDEVQDQVSTMQTTVTEDRAERLADRAADRVRNPERKLDVWKRVKARAIQNKRDGKPLREGLEDLVF